MNLSFPLIAGLIASILHVITGPDHLAAVTPFAIESKKESLENRISMGNRAFNWNAGYWWLVYRL